MDYIETTWKCPICGFQSVCFTIEQHEGQDAGRCPHCHRYFYRIGGGCRWESQDGLGKVLIEGSAPKAQV